MNSWTDVCNVVQQDVPVNIDVVLSISFTSLRVFFLIIITFRVTVVWQLTADELQFTIEALVMVYNCVTS